MFGFLAGIHGITLGEVFGYAPYVLAGIFGVPILWKLAKAGRSVAKVIERAPVRPLSAIVLGADLFAAPVLAYEFAGVHNGAALGTLLTGVFIATLSGIGLVKGGKTKAPGLESTVAKHSGN